MPIRSDQFNILKLHLENLYVAHLPNLIQPRNFVEDSKKNVDRSFSAFAIDHICKLDPKRAARTVVDDFGDHGIDAVYYDIKEKILYFIQAKLKEAASFTQDEALSFTQGIRKLVKYDFSGFNVNLKKREEEIRKALDDCNRIQIVIAHTGEGINANADRVMRELLSDKAGGELRLCESVLSFDSAMTVDALHSVNAVEPVNCRIRLHNLGAATEPKVAYYGTVALSTLAELHQKYGKALYQKNIRTWLGHRTPVNEAIRETLATNPANFQYLNNGVTALCGNIAPRGGKNNEYRDFELTDFSIINGAQTVASTANFSTENSGVDLSDAKVMMTLIKADSESDFGKRVTRARNTQNDVKEIAFAALDEEQERIRRELQHLDIEYVYRVGETASGQSPNRILLTDALQALAVFELDPRYPVWMKRSLPDFQKTDGEPYKQIFSQSLSSVKLANAVMVHRYIKSQVSASKRSSYYNEKKAYNHGEYCLSYVFAKQFRQVVGGSDLIDADKLNHAASNEYDTLRQILWDIIGLIEFPGALAISKNLDRAMNLIREMMTKHYRLEADPVVERLRAKNIIGQPYQVDLFKYLVSKAPQIGNIT